MLATSTIHVIYTAGPFDRLKRQSCSKLMLTMTLGSGVTIYISSCDPWGEADRGSAAHEPGTAAATACKGKRPRNPHKKHNSTNKL